MDDTRPTPGLYHGIFWIGVIAFAGMALGGLYHAFTRYSRPPAIALRAAEGVSRPGPIQEVRGGEWRGGAPPARCMYVGLYHMIGSS